MPSIEEAIELFLKDCRAGRSPSITAYQRLYPDFSQEIGELFPTIRLIESDVKQEEKEEQEEPQANVLPEQIGGYHIRKMIGSGGMGIVYEADDADLARLVALKVLHPYQAKTPVAQRRFRREAQMAARLHHTNIVPVFDSGLDNGVCYYVMQEIQGVGIDRFLTYFRKNTEPSNDWEDKPQASKLDSVTTPIISRFLQGGYADPVQYQNPEKEKKNNEQDIELTEDQLLKRQFSPQLWRRSVCGIGIQIAQALNYAHHSNVLHRDIKPSNLLLDADGVVWITDFGLARPVNDSDLTCSGQIVGTLRYIAPEALSGEFLPAGDIYSLGLTLYELLTFTPAFEGNDYKTLFQRIGDGDIRPLRRLDPTIPKDLETIVLKAVDKNPAKRYENGAALADDLRRFLEERPIQARRISAVGRFTRWCRRNRILSALTVSFILLLFLLTAGMTFEFFQERSLRQEQERTAAQARMNLENALDAFKGIFGIFHESSQSWNFIGGISNYFLPLFVQPITETDQQILVKLLEFYDSFAVNNADNVSLKIETARAYANIGRIDQRMRQPRRAIEDYQQSIEYYRAALLTYQDTETLETEEAMVVYQSLPLIGDGLLQENYLLDLQTKAIEALRWYDQHSLNEYAAAGKRYDPAVDRAMVRATRQRVLAKLLCYRAQEAMISNGEKKYPSPLYFLLDDEGVQNKYPQEEIVHISADLQEALNLFTRLNQAMEGNDPYLAAEYNLAQITEALWLALQGNWNDSRDLAQKVHYYTEILTEKNKDDITVLCHQIGVNLLEVCINRINPSSADLPEQYAVLNDVLKRVKKLQDENPEVPGYPVLAMLILRSMSMLDSKMGETVQSEETLRQIETLRRQFIERFPDYFSVSVLNFDPPNASQPANGESSH